MAFDGKQFGAEVVGVVKDYVERSLSPVVARLEALEKRLNELPSPKDGKDADEEAITSRVTEKIAADLAELRKSIEAIPPAPELPNVAGMIEEAIGALPKLDPMELAADIDARVQDAVSALRPAQDGKDADPEVTRFMVASEVERAVAALPRPQDGKSVTIEELRPLVEESVSAAVSALPKAKDGEPGRSGERGEKGDTGDRGPEGPPGKDALPPTREEIVEAILSMSDALDEAVQRYLAANPPPPGKDGRDGADGTDGQKGEQGLDGKDGRDGVGLAGAIIDRSGNLILTLTDGTTRALGQVVGKDGAPGKDGRDGFSLSDFDASLKDDGRTVLLSFGQGEIKHSVELGFPAMIYRGVFKEGQEYRVGDTVTWGGSLWHCDEATTEKPDGGKSWTLAAKRGRDGKDGVLKAEKPKEPVKVG